jgi:hypothetical protein
MATLDGAITAVKSHGIAILVGKKLYFKMARV